MLNQYKKELEEISLRWGNDAIEKNASLAASKETMANVLKESAKVTAETIHNDLERVLSHTSESLRRTERIAMINLAASALTVLAIGMIVLGILR